MNRSLLILGRQPTLGMAELESIYGFDKLRPIGRQAVLLDVDPCLVAFERLGGSIKFCLVLETLPFTNFDEIKNFLLKQSPEHSKQMPEGKMHLGISMYDFDVSPKQVTALALSVKKAVQTTGRSVRVVPNETATLNSAQVIHNRLLSNNGWELVLVKNGDKTIVCRSLKEQNISSYTIRDRGRPKRDSRVGMLPPKLAQIILNLAAGLLPEDSRLSVCEIPPDEPVPLTRFRGIVVLDPFCGTGVVLQEALLLGYAVYGSDNNPAMVKATKENLEWLPKQIASLGLSVKDGADSKLPVLGVEEADATTHTWSPIPNLVATESYLGRTYINAPKNEELAQNVSTCNLVIKKFLRNIFNQISPGSRLCIAVPAWQISPKRFKHLPLIDQIDELGYNQVRFKSASSSDLIYFRTDQIVARELLVIERKNVTR